MDITKIFDRYSISARLIPSAIIVIMWWLTYTPDFFSLFQENQILGLIWKALMAVIIWYTFSEVIRQTWRIIERLVYWWREKFPTALFLLWKKSLFDKKIEKQIKDKIKSEFDLNRRSEDFKRVSDIISLIRKKVWNGKLLLNYNIRYGFFRNLFWWLFLLELSIIVYSVFYINIFFQLNNIIVIVTNIVSYFMMKISANEYARNLLLEYFQIKENKWN